MNCKCGTANVVTQLQMWNCKCGTSTANVVNSIYGAANEANCECMKCKYGPANVVPQLQMWSIAFVETAYKLNCKCDQPLMLQLHMYELQMYNSNCESCKCSFTTKTIFDKSPSMRRSMHRD